MPRTCTVCAHPDRDAVDAALVAGEAFRHVAARFGLSTGALQRHRAAHLPPALARAREAEEALRAETLLERLRALNRETADVLRQARRAGDHDLRLRALARAEKQLELEARLLGELREGAAVNVLVLPEWAALRAAVLGALAPHPEARLAVAAALAAGADDAGR